MTGMKRTTEKNLMVFSGRAHPDLATEVADLLECGLVPQDARAFANGELYVRYEESVRGCDAFVLPDDLGRILPGLRVARRARRIALESVAAGIGLSVAGMIGAAFGLITPVQGALLQEAIDVAVILNALRVLRPEPRRD